MVKQVAAFVVNLVDICAELNESFDFIVLTSDKRILGSKLAIKIHLLNVSAKTKQLVRQLEITVLVEDEERGAIVGVWQIKPDIAGK